MIADRGVWVDQRVADTLRVHERLCDVLCGIASGMPNAEIGAALFITENTVKTHCRRLFARLGARDRAHAVALAYEAGLLRGPAGRLVAEGAVRSWGVAS